MLYIDMIVVYSMEKTITRILKKETLRFIKNSLSYHFRKDDKSGFEKNAFKVFSLVFSM